MILIIKERATLKQVEEMLQTLEVYIKIAVDIEKGILAGGGQLHAECEAVLLKDGSKLQRHLGCRLDTIYTKNGLRVNY